MFLELRPSGSSASQAVRFVPLALSLHSSELFDLDVLWGKVGDLGGFLSEIASSEQGDFYESRNQRYESYGVDHQRGVIVLGSYERGEKALLLQIRDILRQRGYDAHLIDGLPETSLMSLPRKVRQWTGASRFSVMVDRLASGHLNEYEILRSQDTILAVLRSKPKGSTWMIDGPLQVDVNFIKVFMFDESPLEVIDEAVTWAEAFAEQRSQTKLYPWSS